MEITKFDMKKLGLLLLCVLLSVCGCKQQTSATAKLNEKSVKVGIMGVDWPKTVPANTSFKVQATIINAGADTIPALGLANGSMKVGLTYHWRSQDEKVVVWDGFITDLKSDLKKGSAQNADITVWAPPVAGRYILEIDLVQSGAFWFGGVGSQTARFVIDVT